MASTLIVEVMQGGVGETVIRCSGELDLASAAELTEAVAWSLTADLKELHIDATKLDFCDSTGLRCLLDASAKCHARGIRLTLAASRQLTRLLRLVKLPLCDGLVAEPNGAHPTPDAEALRDPVAQETGSSQTGR